MPPKKNTISNTINIKIKTRGDYVTDTNKPITFTTNMIDPNNKTNSPIYFTSNIKLTDELIKDANLGVRTKDIFSNPGDFTRLLQYAMRPGSGFKPLILQQAKKQGIVDNNIEFLMKMYFPYKGKFFIDGKVYIIRKSEIIKTNITSNSPFSIEIELALIDGKKQPNMVGFKRENCKDQAKNLDEQAKKVLGINLGLGDYTLPKRPPPVMYTSSKTGVTTGKKKPQQTPYNPYGYNPQQRYNPYGYNPQQTPYNPYRYNPQQTPYNPYGYNPQQTPYNPYRYNPQQTPLNKQPINLPPGTERQRVGGKGRASKSRRSKGRASKSRASKSRASKSRASKSRASKSRTRKSR